MRHIWQPILVPTLQAEPKQFWGSFSNVDPYLPNWLSAPFAKLITHPQQRPIKFPILAPPPLSLLLPHLRFRRQYHFHQQHH
jgi:hypothetical protein